MGIYIFKLVVGFTVSDHEKASNSSDGGGDGDGGRLQCNIKQPLGGMNTRSNVIFMNSPYLPNRNVKRSAAV